MIVENIKRQDTKPLHLYFIKSCNNLIPDHRGYIKIGKSWDPYGRLRELQTGNPHRLKIIAIINGGYIYERYCHKLLAHLHVRGEWFEYTEEIDMVIEKLKIMILDVHGIDRSA
jgi:hypothetical protein